MIDYLNTFILQMQNVDFTHKALKALLNLSSISPTFSKETGKLPAGLCGIQVSTNNEYALLSPEEICHISI